MTKELMIKNIPENKEFLISYPDGSRLYLTEKQFVLVTEQFLANKNMVLLKEEKVLLTNKFTWAGKIKNETYLKPEKMTEKEQLDYIAKK